LWVYAEADTEEELYTEVVWMKEPGNSNAFVYYGENDSAEHTITVLPDENKEDVVRIAGELKEAFFMHIGYTKVSDEDDRSDSTSRRTDEDGARDEDGAEGGIGAETTAKSILDTYGIHSCPILDLTGKTPLGLLDATRRGGLAWEIENRG